MNFMVIIKRSGEEVLFDRRKIENAIAKANTSVEEWERASAKDRELVARRVEEIAETAGHPMGVEEIQDAVEEELMKLQLFKLARNYTVYRYKREIARKSNTTDEQIMSLIERNNEEVKQENSNKNPTINSVQRDYMAGEVSKDLTRRFLRQTDRHLSLLYLCIWTKCRKDRRETIWLQSLRKCCARESRA